MKKQLLLLFAIMMAICSYGQSWKRGGLEKAPVKAPFIMNGATITPGEGQCWWGYMSETDLSTSDGVGVGSPNVPFMACIYVPANHDQIGGSTIKAVRVYVLDGLGATMNDVSVWISKNKPSSLASADYVQSVSSLSDGANDIELITPYSINNQAFYVGYAVTSSNSYPIMCCGTIDAPNSFLICSPGNMAWEDLNGYGFGKLAFQILVDGVQLASNSATPSDFETGYVIKETTGNVPVKITNNGKQPITSLSYTITTGGNTTEEKMITVSSISFNSTVEVNFPFPADADTRKYDKTLTITKVNGVDNEAADKTAQGSVITITEKPVVVPVVEEFTGTWCGYCPIGFEGMKYAHDTYGDKVVLIAVHYNDPMQTSDYNAILNLADNFPSSVIDRTEGVYPHPAYFKSYLPIALARTTLGSITAQAMWTSNDKTAIKIDTKTKFVYSVDNGNYGIAFALVEDGMKGTGSSWAQTNYLSGSPDYSSFTFWYNAAAKVTGLEYDHVAVAAWNIASGAANSVSPTIVADEIQNYSFTADITSKSLIQDKSKLKVVALLIDKTTGGIVNASQVAIQDYTPTSIEGVHHSANVGETERYTLDGRQINAPQRGVNIVRMSDGTTRKVIVK